MTIDINHPLVKAIEKHAYPFENALMEYDPIISAAKDKQFVLIGEASHGTQEFYRIRAEISKRLIQELGFDAVAVEADWPNAYSVNRYVTGLSLNKEALNKEPSYKTAKSALRDFERFPTWMWRNLEVMHFVQWLYLYNQERRAESKQEKKPVGFYGLDLYSMNTSIHAVLHYLKKVDPQAAVRAKARYACLDHFMDNPQAYGYAAEFGLAKSCEEEIITQLKELRRESYRYMQLNGMLAEDEYFCAEQNAKLVKNAETYYRSLFGSRANSWNVRDQHMFSTLQDLTQHLSTQLQRDAKIIVWAHNSHVGNARATEMTKRGEINIGQLVKEAYGDQSLLIGFSTCRGTVTAASDWDAPVERKRVREPIAGSYEEVFHHVNYKQFFLNLKENNNAIDLLIEPRLQRAIGVIYRPESERMSHYFYSCLPEQFDFILHLDNTTAVEPLEAIPLWHRGELEETYPFGI